MAKEIKYNQVVYDVLNKVVDFQPKEENLGLSTNNALRVIFNLHDTKQQPQVDVDVKDQKLDQNTDVNSLGEKLNLKDTNKARAKEVEKLKGNDKNPSKNYGEEISKKDSESSENTYDRTDNQDKIQEQNKNNQQDQSFNRVLETYISEHTDLETRIAYLKSFASTELLKNVEEELRKKEHEQYVKMVQTAGEIRKEEKMAEESHMQSNHMNKKNEDQPDQDLFDEDDFTSLDRLDEIFKDFDHEKDDHIEQIQKNVESTQNIKPLICFIREFKNTIEKSEKTSNDEKNVNDKDEKSKATHIHPNKFVASLCSKYMNSNPQEKENLLKVLEILNTRLKSQQAKIQQAEKVRKSIIQKQNKSSYISR